MRTRLAKVLAAVAVVIGLATPAAAGPAIAPAGPCASVGIAGDVSQADDSGPFLFTVTVTAPLGCAVRGSVNYHTEDGNPGATAPEDYTSTSGTLSWDNDTTPRTIQVPVVPDGPGETSEQFWLVLDSPVGLTVTGGAAVGGILGNQNPSIISTQSSPRCWVVCKVGVHVTGAAPNGEQVHWRTVDNGGPNLGYVPVQEAVLSIPPNASRGEITVELNNPNQRQFQFQLQIFAPSFGVLGNAKSTVTVTPNG